MIERTSGKLVIKTYINHNQPDQHGRQSGKWVTLMTQHGLSYEEADTAGREFIKNNERFSGTELFAQWMPYAQHVYL
jgi:hypothetical protein